MLSIKIADIFKANFYYYYPIIISITLLIMQTFHTHEMVCIVADIRKSTSLIFFWAEFYAGFEMHEMLGTSIC